MNKAYYDFNKNIDVSSVYSYLYQLENKINNLKLMYRRPGSQKYENITESLDDIFTKINYLDARIKKLEESDLKM